MTAFRFLNKPATEQNFVPLDESRKDCVTLALSFWETLEKAQRVYRSIAATNDDGGVSARNRLGDHVGEILLTTTDGVMDVPNAKGHVSLHQADDVAFAHRVASYTMCAYLVELEGRNAP
jgi:hypothetical protein